jgi:hypothetical protein
MEMISYTLIYAIMVSNISYDACRPPDSHLLVRTSARIAFSTSNTLSYAFPT